MGGYSPVIYYLQLQQIFTAFNPNKVILFLYSNDVREDKDYLKQATYNQNKLTGINGGMNPLKYLIIRNSYLLRLIRKFYMQTVFIFLIKVKPQTSRALQEKSKLSDNDVVIVLQNLLDQKIIKQSPNNTYCIL